MFHLSFNSGSNLTCKYKDCNESAEWIRVRPSSLVTFEVLACPKHAELLS